MSDDTGTLATVISTERKQESEGDESAHMVDVIVDAGGGDNTPAELYQPPGDDALPLPGDGALLQEAPGSGNKGTIGFNDPANEGKAAPGEKRFYSRQQSGALAADIWLKNDGSVHIEIHDLEAPVYVKTKGPVIIDSPDIRIGDEGASRPIACVGDFVAGSINALCTAPGNLLAPAAGAPTASGGVPFVGQIISGCAKAKGT